MVNVNRALFEQALNSSVGEHGIRDFDKAGNGGALDIVHEPVPVTTVLDAFRIDLMYDALEAIVDLFVIPGQSQRILALFQSGHSNAPSVGTSFCLTKYSSSCPPESWPLLAVARTCIRARR